MLTKTMMELPWALRYLKKYTKSVCFGTFKMFAHALCSVE